ncbi:synaptotagmin-5 isoform X1 [Phymastichus coffea]|uniref:synaptotagmin-5 isoform X1 n=1 Tax=Phymastichus coffea TaxID=108790 RepID=UPI00273B6043|nr:synaptotagmin-5 isoform X1 [Phymastichus coffea]
MVSSAVLGAAAGTGLALVIAVTIVVYRYYALGRKAKSWSSLDRWPDPPRCPSLVGSDQGKIVPQQLQQSAEDCHALNCCRGARACYYAVQPTDFSVSKEQHAVQPSSSGGSSSESPGNGGAAQSSRPSSRMGLVMGRTLTSLSRRPSSGSQEQLPAIETASPQIRAYGPDGRHHNQELLHAASSYPPSRSSRSPSPIRAASLDARCPSPLPGGQSAAALTHLASSQSALIGGPSSSASPGRCLSPLLIPPPRASFSAACSDGSAPPASPLGALQPDLYQRRDQPLFLSSGRRSGKHLGKLHLRLSYDFDKSDLNVHLIEAQELASSEQGGFRDPYVKLTLSPEVDARKRQTGMQRYEPNPSFDQHFKFPVGHEQLQDKTLLVQVLDHDRFSRNDVVGSVRIALEELQLSSSASPVEVWGEISRERKPPEETQEVCISLSYLPSAERLTLIVMKARNLFPQRGKHTLDSFVKVGLLCGEKRVKKRKTAVCKATRSPVWNESMSFNVPASLVASSAVEICVVDSSADVTGSSAIVGSCIVGPSVGPTPDHGLPNPSREHWLHITSTPRKAVAMWHTLH